MNASTRSDLFLMANLSPLFTGLPFVVWISLQNAPHDIRVKISRGGKAIPENLILIALRPTLRVIGNESLSQEELGVLDQWVTLNWDTLLAYWNGEIFTEEAIARLEPIHRK